MRLSALTDLQHVGWPGVIVMAITLAGLLLAIRYDDKKRREQDVKKAESIYRAAVSAGDPDLIAIAARRLRDARRRAP